jgi:hypothetical protein
MTDLLNKLIYTIYSGPIVSIEGILPEGAVAGATLDASGAKVVDDG